MFFLIILIRLVRDTGCHSTVPKLWCCRARVAEEAQKQEAGVEGADPNPIYYIVYVALSCMEIM